MGKIILGPAGLGPVKDAIGNLEEYHKLGFRACEIAFTYSIYIHKEEDMKRIGEKAEDLGIRLSIHAPYWINLNSKEKQKIEDSKKRILSCCEVGEKMGAKRVVFHPGFYSGMDEEETYGNIKDAVLDMQKEIKGNGWEIELAPEVMGKINVFGSPEQIARLVKDTGCKFCIDFAHVLAREKKEAYVKIKKLFANENSWHCHFSGIEYGEKGEKRHVKTPIERWRELLKNLPKDKNIVIINESPDMVNDCVEGLRILG